MPNKKVHVSSDVAGQPGTALTRPIRSGETPTDGDGAALATQSYVTTNTLLRAADDWSAFTANASPADTDLVLMERASDGAKRKVTRENLLGAARIKFTAEGGLAVKLTNKTGAASVKGTVVDASTATDNAFNTITADDPDPIGVVYEDGVADGSECWIVILGRCQVLLEDSTAATRGYWVKVSDNANGRADATNAAPPGGSFPAVADHMSEIGHALESQSAGTNVLCYIMLHFN